MADEMKLNIVLTDDEGPEPNMRRAEVSPAPVIATPRGGNSGRPTGGVERGDEEKAGRALKAAELTFWEAAVSKITRIGDSLDALRPSPGSARRMSQGEAASAFPDLDFGPQPETSGLRPKPTPEPRKPQRTPEPTTSDIDEMATAVKRIERAERERRIRRLMDPERAARDDMMALPKAEATPEALAQIRNEKAARDREIRRLMDPKKAAHDDMMALPQVQATPEAKAQLRNEKAEEERQIRRLMDPEGFAAKEARDRASAKADADRENAEPWKRFGDLSAKAADTAAGVGSKLAGNDNFSAILQSADAAATALGKIPEVGPALEATIKATTVGLTALEDVVKSFVSRGRELQGFDTPLSVANARADIRSTMDDITEAQKLGPGLARLTDAQSRFESTVRDQLLPIKAAIIDVLVPAVEMLTDGVKATLQVAESAFVIQKGLWETIGKLGTGGWNEIPDVIKGVHEQLRKLAAGKAEADPVGIGDQQLRDMARGISDRRRTPRDFDPVIGE